MISCNFSGAAHRFPTVLLMDLWRASSRPFVNSFWCLVVTFPRFWIKTKNFSQFPPRLVSKYLHLSNQVLNFATWLSYLSGLSMSLISLCLSLS